MSNDALQRPKNGYKRITKNKKNRACIGTQNIFFGCFMLARIEYSKTSWKILNNKRFN